MNILGEGFPKEIIKQVELRQKKYGAGYDNSLRTSNETVFLNSKNAWCKLVSSTDITNKDILNNLNIKSLNYNSDELAKNFILFSGMSSQNFNSRAGINNNDFFDRTKAYTSWGIPNADWGYRPMAGIVSATIKHKNLGSIRAASVNIKAWDKISFEIIDVLYLRLGFSVLLEWGNSMYYNNNDEFITNPNDSLANDFLDGKGTYKDFLKKINDNRLSSFGNYDAMFAKVTNFHWSFNPDGSYDIILDLISIGDIIESFKAKGNIIKDSQLVNSTTEETINLETSPVFTILKEYSSTSDISNYLYKITQLLFLSNKEGKGVNYVYNISTNTDVSNYWDSDGDFDQARKSPFRKKDACVIISVPAKYTDKYRKTENEGFIRQIEKTGPQIVDYYIRLGNLLKFFEEGLMYKVKNSSGETSMLKFDYFDDNYMHVPPQMMSYDPSICMVRRSTVFPGITADAENIVNEYEYFNISGYIGDGSEQIGKVIDNFAEPFMVDGLDEVGKIMNIYINFRYILIKLNELTDKETNEVKLIDLLKEILSGINGSFGGYSKLSLFIDETTNEVKIIDQNPLPSNLKVIDYINNIKINQNIKPLISKEYALFDLYGYIKKQEGSTPYHSAGFIKEFKFNTELTPEFSTMIAVTATSNGNAVGENNTALSKLNLGLKDRFKEEVNGNGSTFSENSDKVKKYEENKNTAIEEYNNFIRNSLVKYLKNLYYGVYIPNEVQDNKNSFSIYLKLYKKARKAIDDYDFYTSETQTLEKYPKFQPGTGFIPFNLSLTMDGLSGIKIGSKFLINSNYLPSNYPETVDFLVKNVSHEIKDNKWITTLESYCISQGDNNYSTYKELTSNKSSSPNPIATPSVPTELGSNADFWSLVAIAAAENYNDNPQGMADVAQSIYNRLAAKTYGRSIKELITAPGQYEPTFKNINDWKAIKDEVTAIKAYQNSKKTSSSVAAQAISISKKAITSSIYKQKAKDFVESRTEFYGGYEFFVKPSNLEKGKQKYKELLMKGKVAGAIERSSKDNLFFWRYSGKEIYYNNNNRNAQPPPQNLSQLI